MSQSTPNTFGATPAGDPAAGHRIDIDGQEHAFAWPREEVLLDAMLNAGIDARYSCHMGECGACMCYLEGGRSHMLKNQVLSDYEVADGLTLACQTVRDEEGPYQASYD